MEFKPHGKVHAMDSKDECKQPLREKRETKKPTDPYIRAENEDDDATILIAIVAPSASPSSKPTPGVK